MVRLPKKVLLVLDNREPNSLYPSLNFSQFTYVSFFFYLIKQMSLKCYVFLRDKANIIICVCISQMSTTTASMSCCCLLLNYYYFYLLYCLLLLLFRWRLCVVSYDSKYDGKSFVEQPQCIVFAVRFLNPANYMVGGFPLIPPVCCGY